MKALQMKKFGVPSEVVELADVPEPKDPAEGEVLARIEYSPINNSELLKIQGRYPVRPGAFPATLGNEGVARIITVGAKVSHLKAGDLISIPPSHSTWQEKVLISAEKLFALPAHADIQQLSMLAINPPTAAAILSDFVSLSPDDWVIQNAANSGVGESVTAIAKDRRLKVVSVVRRPELVDALLRGGSDVVLVDGPDLPARVAKATSNAKIRLGLDGVGGEATGTVTSVLAPGGTVVQYSLASGKPGTVSGLDLIFRNVTIRGYWLLSPFFADSPAVHEGLKLGAKLVAEGKLRQPVAAVYPFSQAKEALANAQGKKILFKVDG